MIKKLTGLIIFVGLLFSIYFYIDSWKADAEDVKQLKSEFYLYKAKNRYESVQERVWKLEDMYQNREMPSSVRDEHRKLMLELKLLDKELEVK